MGLKEKVGRDSARTLIFGALSGVVGIITGIIVAKALGPSGKGVYSGVLLFHSGVVAVLGGIGSAITYNLTRRAQPLWAVVRPLTILLPIATLGTWSFLALWAVFKGSSPAWIIMLIVVPASIIIAWQGSLYVSLDRIKKLNHLTTGISLAALIAIAAALFIFHLGVFGALAAWAGTVYINAVIVIAFALGKAQAGPKGAAEVRLSEIVGYSLRACLSGLLTFFNYRIDSLLVIGLLGTAGFGVYSVAVGIAELLLMVSQSLATATARSIGALDFAASAAVTARALRLNALMVGTIGAVLFVIAPTAIALVYGQRFAAAGMVLRILMPGVILYSSLRISSSFFNYQLGRPMFSVYLTLVVIALQSLGCLILIPRLGLRGAAIASTIAYCGATLGQTWYFCRITKLPPAAVWIPKRADLHAFREVVRVLMGLSSAPLKAG